MTLRTALILPFLGLIFIAMSLTAWLSIHHGHRSVEEIVSQVQNELTVRIVDRLERFVTTAHTLNTLHINSLQLNQISIEQPQALQQHFWKHLQAFPTVYLSYYADAKTHTLYGAVRTAQGQFLLSRVDKQTQFDWHDYLADEQGLATTELIYTAEDYDPTTRPWYRVAVTNQQASWSDIYADFVTNELMITAAQPLYHSDGQLRGVVASDITLKDISQFLKSLIVAKNGETFIIDRSGLLIASSAAFPILDEKDERIYATNYQDRLIQTAAQFLQQQMPTLDFIRQNQQFNFTMQGDHYLQITPWKDGHGLDWLIAVVVPKQDFIGNIETHKKITLFLMLFTFLVTVFISWLLANWLLSPVLNLNHAAQQLANGHLNKKLPEKGSKELKSLTRSFNRMARQLQELVTNLEQKVTERTKDLADANAEISELNKKLQMDNLRMSAELEVTHRLQQMLLPKNHELNKVAELEIAGFMESADEVGGDYYDILPYGDERLKIGIGDVTGHGLESSVLMLMVQTAVRTLLLSGEKDPVRFFDVLNQTIYENVQRMDSDKNLTLALIDYSNGSINLSGQHEEMLVVRAGGRIIEQFDTIDLGFPIGLEKDIKQFIAQREITLNSGDLVVLYTDGITEAQNDAGEFYGLERLCRTLRHNWQENVVKICQTVITDLHTFIGKQQVYDDITLLILRQK